MNVRRLVETLFGSGRMSSSTRRKSPKLGMESLETRQVLSASGAALVAPNGVIDIQGHHTGDDTVIVSQQHGVVKVQHSINNGPYSVSYWSQASKIRFVPHQGSAYFRNDTNIASEAFGDSGPGNTGNVTFIGGSGNDVLHGGRGNDRLVGRGGDDDLRGNDGNDVIKGGRGRDYLEGGSGRDRLFGGAGRDRLVDGGWRTHSGRTDEMYGGSGNDILHLQFSGPAKMYGGSGNDKIYFVSAPNGGQFIYPGQGVDKVFAKSHLGGPYRKIYQG